MSKLANLKPSFTSLSYEERLNLILTIRMNRRISKRPTVKKDPTIKGSVRKLIKSLDPETIAQLIQELEGEPSG